MRTLLYRITILFLLCFLWSYQIADSAFIGVTTTGSTSPLTNGLVGHWTFDGKDIVSGAMRDKSGNNNTANFISIATSTFYRPGKIGQAGKFDGVNDYASTTVNSFSANAPMTISVWFKPNSASTGGSTLNVVFFPGQTYSGAGIGQINTQLVFHIGSEDFGGGNTFTGIVANTWYHAVGVFDGSNQSLYVNGISAGTVSLKNLNSFSSLNIGRSSSASFRYFPGSIDDVRIYNRALSAQEVFQLYSIGAGTKMSSSPSTATSTQTGTDNSLMNGLSAYWTFDGKDVVNGGMRDKSGNNYVGTFLSISTSTFYKAGKIGQAGNFDGTNDYMKVPTAPTLTVPYSVSLWFYPTKLSSTQAFIKYSLSNPAYGISLTSSNVIEVDSYSAGTFRTFCNKTFTASDLNKWYHLTFIINSSTNASLWKCYLNNVDIGVSSSDSSGTYGNPPSTNWTIGTYWNNGYWFKGKLDDIRVYSRALSVQEISQLYSTGAGTKMAVYPSMATSTQTSGGLNFGLMGYWTFDGKDIVNGVLQDKSGNNSKGAFAGIATSTFYKAGKVGQAGNFDGVNDTVTVGTSANFMPSAGITTSAWIYPNLFTEGYSIRRGIIDFYTTPSYNLYNYDFYTEFDLNTGSAGRLYFKNAYNSHDIYTSLSGINKWYHVVATADASGYKLYVNGLLANSDTTAWVPPIVAGPLIIGLSQYAYYFKGSIDEVRIYNRALSAGEVVQLYNMGR
ncbi:MAG: LamG domain-containing protein [Candidatus Paceibacterota bacterium]